MDPNQNRQNRKPLRPAHTPSPVSRKENAAASPKKDVKGERKTPRPENAPPRRALTPEEKAERERRARAEAQRRAEEEERSALAAKKARRVLAIVSLVLAILFVTAYWVFVAFSIGARNSGNGTPLLVYTDGNRKEDASFKAEDVVFHGTTYLPVTTFETYFPVTVYGTADTRSILMENGDEAKFYLGTDHAVVNGQHVSLSDISFLKDGTLYLPVDFFTDKMDCFAFTYSSADKSNVLTFDSSAAGRMVFFAQESTAPVDPATVPPEKPPETPADPT